MKKIINLTILILILVLNLITIGFCEVEGSYKYTTNINLEINKLHLKSRGNDLYSDNVKVGFIKDNIEWLSICHLGKKFKFDKLSGSRDKGTWNIYAQKSTYKLKISINEEGHSAIAYVGWGNVDTVYSKKLLDIPDVGEEIYIPLVDLIQLMNLEIIRDYDLLKYKNDNDCNGNVVNGIDIIKYNDWIYYIDKNDNNKLYKIKNDMSNNTKISDDFVDQFYINNNKIYYINLNEKDIGICKINLDGSNKKRIVKGNVSYLNIIDNNLYYCDGLRGGSLYKVNKYGKNKKLLIKDKVIYPNINGDWIYYINTSDKNAIYKITTDGKYNFKINSRFVRSLNTIENNIYFSNYEGTFLINTDGSYEEKISEDFSQNILITNSNLYLITDNEIIKQSRTNENKREFYNTNALNGIGINNDKLFLIDTQYNENIYLYENNIIKKIKDGVNRIEKISYPYVYYKSNENELVKYNIETEETKMLINKNFYNLYEIIDDWIYYEDFYNRICKIKTNGTDKNILTNRNIARVYVDASGIYYLESYHGSIGDFYKLNLDGNNNKVIINDLEKDCHFSYDIYDDYIYYPQKKGLYRINKDGTNKIKLCDKYIHNFIIKDKYIYFNYENNIYRITLDGKNEEKLIDSSCYFFKIYKNNLIYLKNDNDCFYLYEYNLINKEIKSTKFDGSSNIIGLEDKYLYITIYNNDINSLYQLNLDTNEMTEICDAELIHSFDFYKDKVIYLKESNSNYLIEK